MRKSLEERNFSQLMIGFLAPVSDLLASRETPTTSAADSLGRI